MTSKELKILKKKKDHLDEWLRHFKDVQQIAPYVQVQQEITDWELRALENAPEEADKIPMFGLYKFLNREYEHLKTSLSIMADYDINALQGSIGTTLTSTASIYVYIKSVGDMDTPLCKKYSVSYLEEYKNIQKAQERPNTVRKLLEQFGDTNIIERFDRAYASYNSLKIDTVNRTSAATEMRNLLMGLKGILWEKALRQPKENMKWKIMSDRLSKGSIERQGLSIQEKIHSSLISRLSDILKDREGNSVNNIDNIWTEVLDHVYAVINLINLPG